MIKSIEGNFDNPEVNELLTKHFIELRAASPEGRAHVLDIPGLKDKSIKFWSLWENENLLGCGALKFLDNGLVMARLDVNWFRFAVGTLLIFAVVANTNLRRIANKMRE